MIFLKSKKSVYVKTAITLFITALLVTAVILLSRATGKNAGEQGLQIARDSVVRAAVQCYALEGAYPDSLEYLQKNYGVSVNKELYFIDYNYMGINILPEITAMHVKQTLEEILSE